MRLWRCVRRESVDCGDVWGDAVPTSSSSSRIFRACSFFNRWPWCGNEGVRWVTIMREGLRR